MWEKGIDINQVREIRVKTLLYFGVGAIAKIADIAQALKAKGISKVIVMTGRGAYKATGAWDYVTAAFEKEAIDYVLYNKVTPNPDNLMVDEAAAIGREFGAQAVLAIGGGSPIDAGKSVAVLLKYTDKTAQELYELAFAPEEAAPIVAINLTHGTGTEVDRFAVVSIPAKDYKPAIAYDCLYPLYSIDDPGLTTKLSPAQTRYVSVDAVNHVIEAGTSKAASPLTVGMAKETIRLVAEYLPKASANPEDLEARYYLMYASMIAGVAFDNGLLHFTHALEHPLSAVKPELSHGLGLSMLLPAVIKTIYPAMPEVLADILSPIVAGLKGDVAEAVTAAHGVEIWLKKVGVPSKLTDEGYSEADVEKLTELAMTTPSLDLLLSMAPVDAGKDTVATIYRESLTAYTV
jgi:alcohol dehydrogenase class IV